MLAKGGGGGGKVAGFKMMENARGRILGFAKEPRQRWGLGGEPKKKEGYRGSRKKERQR